MSTEDTTTDPATEDSTEAEQTTDATARTEGTTTETTETAPEGTETAPEGTDGAQGAPEGREAAKYRRQLRETERDRDALAERVTGYQRAEVEAMVATAMQDPRDVWIAGVELADLLDDDGAVDRVKVDERVAAVLADRPHWKPRVPSYNGGPRTSAPSEKGWGEVLRGRS